MRSIKLSYLLHLVALAFGFENAGLEPISGSNW